MIEIGVYIVIITGISQVIKNIGLETKYIPLLNLVLGLLISTFFMTDLSLQERLLQGLIIGLSASGLFDQSKILKGDEV
jgi:hypothetical protein